MYKILIGGIFHETNTFSPFPTGMQQFQERLHLNGQEMVEALKTANSVMGAYIKTLMQQEDVEIIPAVMAEAIPSGVVTKEAITTLTDELLAPLEHTKVDAVLLAMHGAMYCELDDDGDSYVLERLREKVGYDIPVGMTVDLHVNLSRRMLNCVDIMTSYKEYPHADMYQRGLETADLLLKTLRGQIRPVKVWRQLPLVPVLKDTNEPDYAPINEAMAKWESTPGVLVASVVHSFYMTDSADTRAAAFAIADGNASLAEAAVEELSALTMQDKENMVTLDTCTTEQAYEDARSKGDHPVIFADICDNPGAGGTCDAPHILKDLIRLKAEKVLYGMIVDPETAAQCVKAGVGATIPVRLGGKIAPELTGGPVEAMAYVKAVTDGKYKNYGPMQGGVPISIGPTAAIVIGGITVIVASAKTQVYDRALFIAHGLDPMLFDILVVKSSIHYRAGLKSCSKKNYSVVGPCLYTVDMLSLDYKKLLPGTYPFTI